MPRLAAGRRTVALLVALIMLSPVPPFALLSAPLSAQPVPQVQPPLGAIQLTALWTRLGDANGEAGAVEVAVLKQIQAERAAK